MCMNISPEQRAQAERASKQEQTLFVEGRASVRVSPITDFDGFTNTAGKVADLAELDTTEVLLSLIASVGQTANAYKAAESENFLNGVAKILNGVFQLAAIEEIPTSLLLETARANLESVAQRAAKQGVVDFLRNHGLN